MFPPFTPLPDRADPEALTAHRATNDLRLLLQRHQHGRYDPTMSLTETDFWRAARTPDGPGTLHISLVNDAAATAFGPGADWLLATVPWLIAETDVEPSISSHHPAVAKALHKHGVPRVSASRLVLPELVFAILGQRVTGLEAMRQWSALCRHSSEAAPGPQSLLLPPNPIVLGNTPGWQYHRMGIERSRADTIAAVCRRAVRVQEVAAMPLAEGYQRLMAFSGIGLWTAATTMSSSMGDPDAVAVGDFHLKNIISYALAGEPRGTDERMLALLEPYAGHRGRIVEVLLRDGWSAPKYGPRQQIRSISTW